MQIIPTLYLKDELAVAPDGTVNPLFSEDIIKMCQSLKDLGIEAVHINDLNVPKIGASVNLHIINQIKKNVGLFIYGGGSYLSPASAELAVQNGVDVAMIGSIAYQQPEFITQLSRKLPGKVGVHIDLRGGRVTIPGWTVVSNKSAYDYAKRFADQGIKYIYYSDVDGLGNMGPENYQRLLDFCKQEDFSVISNSEITSANDVESMVVLGAPRLIGVTLGNAFYKSKVDIRSVVNMVSDLVLAKSNEATITD